MSWAAPVGSILFVKGVYIEPAVCWAPCFTLLEVRGSGVCAHTHTSLSYLYQLEDSHGLSGAQQNSASHCFCCMVVSKIIKSLRKSPFLPGATAPDYSNSSNGHNTHTPHNLIDFSCSFRYTFGIWGEYDFSYFYKIFFVSIC